MGKWTWWLTAATPTLRIRLQVQGQPELCETVKNHTIPQQLRGVDKEFKAICSYTGSLKPA